MWLAALLWGSRGYGDAPGLCGTGCAPGPARAIRLVFGVVSSLAPPQAGDIASPVCGGVRLVVLGMWCVVFVCLWYVLRFSVCTCVCVRVHV